MGLSGMHVLLIVVVILVFFGPSRLPALGKSLGETIRGFKSGIDGEIDVTRAQQQLPPQQSAQAHEAQPIQNQTKQG